MPCINFITDLQSELEHEILHPVKNEDLIFYMDQGIIFREVAPKNGWTHSLLESRYANLQFLGAVDAKIGSVWIGCTEV